MTRFIKIFVMLLVAVLAACTTEQGHYNAVDPDGWLYADTIVFTPDFGKLKDSVPQLVRTLAVGIRHTNAYEYSNIWIELTTQQPDTLMRDTFNIRLADDFGHWFGTGIGVGYQQVDTLMRDIWLMPGSPILLRHIMRADTLAGIEQAGIVIQ